MNRTDAPAKQPKPFGVNGQREAILPTTPSGDNTASYESGFPPITMILKSAGGLPPKGQDMNQILYELSSLGRWSSTGALNSYDSTFATAINGYPAGALLISNDGNTIYINTIDANTSDPNSGGSGWKSLMTYLGFVSVGVGQSYTDLTSSRTAGVSYTNSTGKPILVSVSVVSEQNKTPNTLLVNGSAVASCGVSPVAGVYSTSRSNLVAIVSNGSTYQLSGTGTIITWSELR